MAIDPSLGIKIVYVLGWTNILSLVLILLSCRCILGLKPSSFSSSKLYMRFYKYHCYYWWLLIASVLLHAIMAFIIFGNPFVR
ncbi:MAG: hypothetical protein Q7J54_04240 [Candidatus Woesearchaeota archaeon]|nr:hypothetical protein [Candidatus Woesearchaeota archaeon]